MWLKPVLFFSASLLTTPSPAQVCDLCHALKKQKSFAHTGRTWFAKMRRQGSYDFSY
jgi:hypothetical protein